MASDEPIKGEVEGGPSPADATRIVSIPRENRAETGPEGTLPPGAILNHTYRIEGLLARGGMGEIYRAVHVELQTEHAIKVIRPELASDPRILELFRREATSLRNVRNDAVVAYDGVFREEDGRLYLVMEFVPGPPLSELIREQPLPPAQVRVLLVRLASGLAAAHDKGIVHRDMSPDNVILPDGRVDRAKIIDFGIAKLTDPGQATVVGTDFAGKFSYVSPEQLGMFGAKVNQCSDIYSLGLVLAAAALGQPLDMGHSHSSIVEARRAVPDLSGIPDPDLRRILGAMLEPDPARRPESMARLIAMLDDSGSAIRPSANPIQEPKPRPRVNRLGMWIAAVVSVLLAGTAAGYWALQQSHKERIAQAPKAILAPQPAKPGPVAPQAATPAPTPVQTPRQPPLSEPTSAPEPALPTPAKPQGPAQPEPKVAESPVPSLPSHAAPAKQVAALPSALSPVLTPPAPRRDLEAEARAVFSSFSCADLVLAHEGGVTTVEGFVGSKPDVSRLRTRMAAVDPAIVVRPNVHEWPFCSALSILQRRATGSDVPAPDLRLNKSDGRYVGGDRLRVEVSTPAAPGFLYVVYLTNDGTAAHLLPMPLRPNAGVGPSAHVTLGDERDYRIGPPFGQDMILAVWSSRELPLGGRPEVEPAKAFLAALNTALEPKIVGQPKLSSAYTYLVSRATE